MEETLSRYHSEGEAPRACIVGHLDEAESSVETKVAEGLSGEHRSPGPSANRKLISEFKVIQNITPLLGDKSKFRQWNQNFINAMGQVDWSYEARLQEYYAVGRRRREPRLGAWTAGSRQRV